MEQQIVVSYDPDYAPCAYLVCRVDENGNFNARDEENTLLVESDWDRPSLAANLGFVPCRDCGYTDGTVDCDHFTASEMIERATNFLDEHLDIPFDDPGYF
jgi:hypothetical protein